MPETGTSGDKMPGDRNAAPSGGDEPEEGGGGGGRTPGRGTAREAGRPAGCGEQTRVRDTRCAVRTRNTLRKAGGCTGETQGPVPRALPGAERRTRRRARLRHGPAAGTAGHGRPAPLLRLRSPLSIPIINKPPVLPEYAARPETGRRGFRRKGGDVRTSRRQGTRSGCGAASRVRLPCSAGPETRQEHGGRSRPADKTETLRPEPTGRRTQAQGRRSRPADGRASRRKRTKIGVGRTSGACFSFPDGTDYLKRPDG